MHPSYLVFPFSSPEGFVLNLRHSGVSMKTTTRISGEELVWQTRMRGTRLLPLQGRILLPVALTLEEVLASVSVFAFPNTSVSWFSELKLRTS
jgi:hypothetical protein